MELLSKRLRTVAFLTAVAAGWTLAAPPSHAGLRDTLENVRDTVKCTTKAVFNPLRVVDWGMKNFEKLTSKEYNRRADATMKEVLAECREAAKNIVARGFGVEKVVDKVSAAASRAKSAADTVSGWFGKGKEALADRRRALAVSKRERPFYEKETGVLGRKSLPKVKIPESRELPKPLDPRMGSGSANVWDSEPARGPRSGEGSRGRNSAWDAAPSKETDPWGGGTEVAAQNPPAPVADVADEGSEADSRQDDGWSAALSKVLDDTPRQEVADDDYADALAGLERRQAEERRLAEAERLRAEEETQLARQRAERKTGSGSGYGSSPSSGSGSSASLGSQDCKDLTPKCRQVINKVNTQVASLSARVEAGADRLSISQGADCMAAMYKLMLDHLPECYASETRPHCQAENQRALKEVRRLYESERQRSRQARSGLSEPGNCPL